MTPNTQINISFSLRNQDEYYSMVAMEISFESQFYIIPKLNYAGGHKDGSGGLHLMPRNVSKWSNWLKMRQNWLEMCQNYGKIVSLNHTGY